MVYGPKESPEKVLKRRRHGRWIAKFLKVLGWTLRFKIEDPFGVLTAGPKPRIWVLWHNRLANTPVWYQRIVKGVGPLYALISASGDGEILATIMAKFGIQAIRGSKSRGGEEALRSLLKQLQQGNSVVITPDGPRGPRYHLQEGVIKLAEWSGVEVVPLDFELSCYFELKTWDRLRIVLPFAKSIFKVRQPFYPPINFTNFKEELIKRLGE